MHIATHLIRIKGTFDPSKWTEKDLKDYVKKKIRDEIEDMYHTDLELFQVKGDDVEVWVFITALPSEASRNIIGKWIRDHIKEDGIQVKSFAIEEKAKLWDHPGDKNFVVLTP